MKKIIFVFTFAMVVSQIASAQPAKSVYFELGGPGIASFNFDTRFSAEETGTGARIGVGGFSFKSFGLIFFPIGFNYLMSKDNKNYFEIGGGVTPVIPLGDFRTEFGTFLDKYGDFASTFGHVNFGYRLQPKYGGFTFRAFISPVFGKDFFIPYYGGVSFGFKF